jgi:hypothetical protein
MSGNKNGLKIIGFSQRDGSQAAILRQFWLKPGKLWKLMIPDINVGAILNNLCIR